MEHFMGKERSGKKNQEFEIKEHANPKKIVQDF